MKMKTTPAKIAKKTAYIFKAVKTKNNYITDPLDMGHTQATSFIF